VTDRAPAVAEGAPGDAEAVILRTVPTDVSAVKYLFPTALTI
jgi:hypothetical protein